MSYRDVRMNPDREILEPGDIVEARRRMESSGVVSEYARLAPRYDEKWAFYLETTTRETLARLSPGPADRLLDVGCGTGTLLHRLAGSHPPSRLSGVDPVPEMLAVARRSATTLDAR